MVQLPTYSTTVHVYLYNIDNSEMADWCAGHCTVRVSIGAMPCNYDTRSPSLCSLGSLSGQALVPITRTPML